MKSRIDPSLYTRTVFTKNGEFISALVLRRYKRGYLLFAQERLIITDHEYNEIRSIDIIDLVSELL